MGVNFSELDFGPLDSNDDANISEYFVKNTDELNLLIDKKKFFVFGAKGIGKTAIKKYITETRAKNNQPVIVFDNNNIINISELSNISNAELRNRFASFFVAIILNHLINTEMISEDDKKEIRKLEDNIPLLKKLIKPLNIKTEFFEYPLKELFSDGKKRIGSSIYDRKVVDCITNAIGEKDIWVLIDDVDTIFDTDDTSIIDKCIENLIYAVSDLNIQIFKGKVNIILFLKFEVWDRIYKKSTELDKESTYFLTIRWTNEHLTKLLSERIKFATKMNDEKPIWWYWGLICKDSKKSEVELIHNYLLERVINGPRDLLLIVGLTQQYTKSNGLSHLEIDFIKQIEFEYGKEKLIHIARNYQNTYPEIENVIERLFRDKLEMYSNGDLQKIISDNLLTDTRAREAFKSLSWVRPLTSYKFIELLYKVGFIGYFDSGYKKFMYSMEKSNANCDFSKVQLMVHKAFHKYLNLQH